MAQALGVLLFAIVYGGVVLFLAQGFKSDEEREEEWESFKKKFSSAGKKLIIKTLGKIIK